MKNNSSHLKEGDYVVYINGTTCELGKIKRIAADAAFVYYHEGDTASRTPFDKLVPVCNSYCITETTLGRNNM